MLLLRTSKLLTVDSYNRCALAFSERGTERHSAFLLVYRNQLNFLAQLLTELTREFLVVGAWLLFTW